MCALLLAQTDVVTASLMMLPSPGATVLIPPVSAISDQLVIDVGIKDFRYLVILALPLQPIVRG